MYWEIVKKQGKYRALIQQTRAGNQISGKTEDQITRWGDQPDGFPDDQTTREPENQANGFPEGQTTRKPETQESTPMQATRNPDSHFSGKPGNQKDGHLVNQIEQE